MNWIYDAEKVSTKASSLNCTNVVQFGNRVRTATLGECQDILNHTMVAFSSILSCSSVRSYHLIIFSYVNTFWRNTPYLPYEIINLAEGPHVYFRKQVTRQWYVTKWQPLFKMVTKAQEPQHQNRSDVRHDACRNILLQRDWRVLAYHCIISTFDIHQQTR
jgi:hypothetical protein